MATPRLPLPSQRFGDAERIRILAHRAITKVGIRRAAHDLHLELSDLCALVQPQRPRMHSQGVQPFLDCRAVVGSLLKQGAAVAAGPKVLCNVSGWTRSDVRLEESGENKPGRTECAESKSIKSRCSVTGREYRSATAPPPPRNNPTTKESFVPITLEREEIASRCNSD